MGDMLSQAEIDALLNGSNDYSSSGNIDDSDLSAQEIDALGEVGNISMGTSATTLFTLLGQKVMITTPTVSVTTWENLANEYELPFVAVKVEYTQGLIGQNLLVLRDHDVKIITDLMMGGDGTNTADELSELHLSAISEAMNQMVGSASTSISSMFDKRIDISPPRAYAIKSSSDIPFSDLDAKQKMVKIAFKMVIGSLVDSEIMQLIPIDFAKSLVENLLNVEIKGPSNPEPLKQQPPPQQQPQEHNTKQPQYNSPQQYAQPQQMGSGMGMEQMNSHNEQPRNTGPINVQPAQFQSFDENRLANEKKNIGIIMDVPLQITVELGRTNRLIKDILEFGPGSIIELDKLAGEPVDILVNGKVIAKGEVVVIDESFGVRITDIIHPSKRL
jgi:flagellar motor switch protein FliN/FliY